MKEIHSLGKLNKNLFSKYFGMLATDEIIVTNERIDHIQQRHPQDVELFWKYGKESIESPDFILEDSKNDATVFMIKQLPDTNLNVVVRLSLDYDEKHPQNSVMTFYRIRERNLRKLLQKNNLLYKKE